MSAGEPTLASLVDSAISGEIDAWNQIVDRMQNLVWSVVRGFRLGEADSHDAAQMTWLRAVENLHKVHDPERLGLWLATTARRECMRTIEKGQRTIAADPQTTFQTIEATDDPATDVALRSDADRIVAALKTLSDNCQALLRMVLCQPPMSYLEIATALDIAVGTIGPRRRRCISQLRAAANM